MMKSVYETLPPEKQAAIRELFEKAGISRADMEYALGLTDAVPPFICGTYTSKVQSND